ncbi:Hypp2234 [Branchiostoma lanceolatum]|uniref:Hypp2234 protein n=1 Tax=Branchiostoma lanceolatum TaxID=7740 RepID=A0A8J9ZPH1_BRALA|nr:Hypp2234 [Branchiostoma lanceolatum]
MDVFFYSTLLVLTVFFRKGCHAALLGNPQVIDMTYTFDDTTVIWPKREPFRLKDTFRGYHPNGYYYEGSYYEGYEHSGTHVDAPSHFCKDKWRMDAVPLERLMGLAVVVDVSSKTKNNADYTVTAQDFQDWEEKNGRIPDGSIVLVRTGWDQFWSDKRQYLGTDTTDTSLLHFPGIDPEGARWLVQNRGMHAVGIDTGSLSTGQSTNFSAHQILCEADIIGLESVANMDKLPTTGATVYALPLKIGEGSGGPARIIGIINNPESGGGRDEL